MGDGGHLVKKPNGRTSNFLGCLVFGPYENG